MSWLCYDSPGKSGITAMERLQNYINGELVDPKSGAYSQIIDPSTGQAYLEAPLSDADDVDTAVAAAKAAFPAWRAQTPAERSLLLFRAADALDARAEDVAAAESKNTGKPLHIMRDVEFPGIVDHFRFYAAAARELRGLASGRFVQGHESSMRREPLGVCAGVSPWNYPLNMSLWKFGPAIAAGNTVVLKPSDTTPVTSVLAAEIIGEVLPAGVLNVVVGDRDTGRLVVSHPDVVHVSVTGSTRAGKEVAAAVAPDLKGVSLELGGKAPILVFGDVDIQSTVESIAEVSFFNAGQDCEAACRILVADEIYDEFVAAFVRRAQSTRYGPPDQDVEYGPLNSEAHLNKVAGYIADLPSHATVHCGGTVDRQGGGFYFPPTVVTGVKQDDRIVQEEVFGPVVTIQNFSDEAEAVDLANDVAFGLAAGLWTQNHDRVLRVTDQLDFGKVWVNCHLIVAAEMPNNGYKHSGYGNDMSVYALEEYTRMKHVMSAVGDA